MTRVNLCEACAPKVRAGALAGGMEPVDICDACLVAFRAATPPEPKMLMPFEFTVRVRLTDVTEDADGTIRGTCDPKAFEDAVRGAIQRAADEHGPIIIGTQLERRWPPAYDLSVKAKMPVASDDVDAPDSDEDPL